MDPWTPPPVVDRWAHRSLAIQEWFGDRPFKGGSGGIFVRLFTGKWLEP